MARSSDPSTTVSSTSDGRFSAAARMSIALYESERRLPTIPSNLIRLCLGRADQLELDRDRDVVGERVAAGRDRGVPVDAVGRAVDDGLELDGDAVLAVEVLRRAGDRAGGLDGLGDAAHGQLALDDQLLAVLLEVRGGEGDLRVTLRVEEVRALEVALELIDGDLDGVDLDGARERRLAGLVGQGGGQLVEVTAEGGQAGVLDGEGRLGVDGVQLPRAG